MLDRPAKLRLAGLAVLILVQTVMEVASVGMILPFIAMMNDPGLIESNQIIRLIRLWLGSPSPTAFLVMYGFSLFGLMLVKNVYCIWVARIQARFGYRQIALLSTRLLERYLAAPYEYHLHRNSADMITTIDKFVDNVFAYVVISAMIMVTEIAAVLGIIVLMVAVEPKLTLILGAVLGGCSFLLAQLMKTRLEALGKEHARFYTSRLRILQQTLTSIKDVKVMGRERFFLSAFGKLRGDHAAVEAANQTLNQLPRPILETIISGGIVLVVTIVLLQGRATADIVGVLGLFAMAAFRVMPGISRIIYSYTTIKNNASFVDCIVRDFFDPSMSHHLDSPLPIPFRFSDAIEFRNVSFTYSGSAEPTIKKVSLVIRHGEAIALVGSSGAGKSTLVDVLLGLLPPQEGQVLVDGRDVTSDPQSWRQMVGYVPQSIALLDDTLRNNVAFGIEPDQIDDLQIWHALRLARLDDFVRALPDGLDTALGERGVRLSGGQRQRVGVARALYRDPDVLVLDEATSALDNEIERQVTEAIETLHGDKTVIVIAHRLSTVERCDRLILLQDGVIAGDGPFKDLVACNREFREMTRLEQITGADTNATSSVAAILIR
jgi:ATP-binding cassette subfamily C protein